MGRVIDAPLWLYRLFAPSETVDNRDAGADVEVVHGGQCLGSVLEGDRTSDQAARVELTGPPSGFSVAYCPEGTYLAAGSGAGTTTLWDAESGLPLLTLSGHVDPVGGLAYSPDGSSVATAGFDGTTRVYVVAPDRLLDLARSRLTRPFTPEECQKYLHLEQCPDAP